jgi:hypothetical protein
LDEIKTILKKEEEDHINAQIDWSKNLIENNAHRAIPKKNKNKSIKNKAFWGGAEMVREAKNLVITKIDPD